MLTISNADKILRSVYLDAVAEEIKENTSPFISRLEETSEYLAGKEIVSPCRIGINGGVGCVSETGNLPTAGSPNYINLKAGLCNVYGNLEISDKLLRLGQGSPSSVVNVLNHEMENLLKSAKFNMRRMLFQNGSGVLAAIDSHTTSTGTVLSVDSTKNLVEGMIIDINGTTGALSTGHTVTYVNRADGTVTITPSTTYTTAGNTLTVQGSFNNEIYGLPYLFDSNLTLFYGNARRNVSFALPTGYTANAVTNDSIQEVLDNIEENYGSTPNLIIASYDMRRKYLEYLRTNCLNIDHKEIEAGFSSITYNGIPLYVEKFAPDNTAYFVNTDDFKLVQPSEWSWLESNEGNILHQMDGKAAYYATLVKYCNLLCVRPMAQASLTYVAPVTPTESDSSDETVSNG